MDNNKLTPSKIKRLMFLAESRTPQANVCGAPKFNKFKSKDVPICNRARKSYAGRESKDTNYGESSGILDLEQCEGFGESQSSFSINKSSLFRPGELTGRSTGTEDMSHCNLESEKQTQQLKPAPTEYSVRHSLATCTLDELVMFSGQQTSEVNSIMADSISNYQFDSHRDMTKDEASFIREEAPIPVPINNTHFNMTFNRDLNQTNKTNEQSFGSYFMKANVPLSKIFPNSDSPQQMHEPVCLDADSRHYGQHVGFTSIADSEESYREPRGRRLDLDNVPVREKPALPPHLHQPRPEESMGDASLSISFIGKCLGQTDGNPSMLIKEAKKHRMATPNPPLQPIENIQQSKDKPYPTATRNLTNSSRAPTFLTVDNPNRGNKENMSRSRSASKSPDPDRGSFGRKSPRCTKSANYYGNNDKSPPHSRGTFTKDGRKSPNSVTSILNSEKSSKYSCGSYNDGGRKSPKPTAHNVDDEKSSLHSRGTFNIGGGKSTTPVASHNNDEKSPKLSPRKPDYGKSTSPKPKLSDFGYESKASEGKATIQENYNSSTIGRHSSHLDASKGCNVSDVQYKELDKSIKWREIFQQASSYASSVDKEISADVHISPIEGFVGVPTNATIKLTSSDSWLAINFEAAATTRMNDVRMELPQHTIYAPPNSTHVIPVTLTCLKSVAGKGSVVVVLKDTAEETECRQEATFDMRFTLPNVLVMTSEGTQKSIVFPPTQAGGNSMKLFALMSDAPVDLHLSLSVSDGASMFTISDVKLIDKKDIATYISNEYRAVNDQGKVKGQKYKSLKSTSKVSRLIPKGMALRVMLMFLAPSAENAEASNGRHAGSMDVRLVASNSLVQQVALAAAVGAVKLLFNLQTECLRVSQQPAELRIANAGTIAGSWRALVRDDAGECARHFAVRPPRVDIAAGQTVAVTVSYTGPEHTVQRAKLVLENVHEGKDTELALVAGEAKAQAVFKVSLNEVCFIRESRKEIGFKNVTDRRAAMKCKVIGAGFSLETCGTTGSDIMLSFGPGEQKRFAVIFRPVSDKPHCGRLRVTADDNTYVKSIRMHGCGSGGGAGLRWLGLTTYGDTALVSVSSRAPLALTMYNHSRQPYFYTCTLKFNVQYRSAAGTAKIAPKQAIVRGKSEARIVIEASWGRFEQLIREGGDSASGCVGSVAVLAGTEATRRRICRILKADPLTADDEDYKILSRLTERYENEDPRMDEDFDDFQETRKSLEDLKKGIQVWTVQIELSKNVIGDYTILLSDETSVNFHTICD